MPIYEYICQSCESKFELLRPISKARELASCPRCQQSSERVPSTFACFSISESGLPSSIGGNSCANCSATSCDSCGL